MINKMTAETPHHHLPTVSVLAQGFNSLPLLQVCSLSGQAYLGLKHQSFSWVRARGRQKSAHKHYTAWLPTVGTLEGPKALAWPKPEFQPKAMLRASKLLLRVSFGLAFCGVSTRNHEREKWFRSRSM